ncbi:unnamed protein product [Closterium sp. NIES-54]
MYKDWKAENEAKIGMRFGEVKSSGLEHVELPLELSSSSTTTRQSSLVNGGDEAKDAEEEEEEVQQQRQGLHVPVAEEEGRGKRRIQAPNRLIYDALGKPAKSALAGAALMVREDEESDYEECAFAVFSPVEMPGEPANLKEALESSDAEEWKKAMESELKSIEENGTWELVELPEGRKAITSKWLFKIKSDADGKIERYKSRLVAKGYQQKEKVDYTELFAPVVKPTTLRTLLAGAAIKGWVVKQMDVTTAFLNGVLEEEIFMAQPEGFDDGSGREIGFTPSTANHSLFMLGEGEQRSFMVVYVDDILIFSPFSDLVKEVMLKVQDKFKCKALGDVSFYLGLHIERDVEKRCMRVHQRKYLEAFAANFGQSEGHVATPFPSGFKCVKGPEEKSVGEEERRRFHSLVGSLMYAAVTTRPDVAFATGQLARVVQCPNEEQVAAGMRVAKYLGQTPTVGLHYSAAAQRRQKGADGVEPGRLFLTAFSDASFASEPEDMTSVGGFICCVGGGPTAWESKKQVDQALSSVESEYMALFLESESATPPSVGGECALSTNVLEDNQEDFECLAATVPRLASMLLALEGDPDAPDIPTPRSYAEAITGPYSSQWHAAMDAEMASWKSTGIYVDEVPPTGANIGVDYFQSFSPTPKMTTLRVLLHITAKRDYELHSMDFSTTFLQGSLYEEIWLRCLPDFTESFPAGTQWSLQRPVYGLRQAPREWHDTLRTTLSALGFAPSTADPSLFLRSKTSLPPFYVFVYVVDLVFDTTETKALTLVKSELQKRHTCTDLGPSALRLPVLLATSTPLSTSHSLSAPPSNKSVKPSGPYPELVGYLMDVMTCTRPDLAYPFSLLARYVAPDRHRKVHWDGAKRVLRYLCSTSGMGLVLGGWGPVVLTGHVDASWFDDSPMQRSSQGYTFSLGFGSVLSTRSSSVLSSSCEAEICAGALAAQELHWLTYLLNDLGEQPRSPPVLIGAGAAGDTGAASPGGARTGGTGAAEAGGAAGVGAGGTGAGGAGVTGAAGPGGSRTRATEDGGAAGVGAGGTRAGAARVTRAAGPGGAHTGITRDAGVGGAVGVGAGDTGAGGAGPGGAGAVVAGSGDTGQPRPYFIPLLQKVLGLPSSTSLTPPLLCPPPDQSQPPLLPASPLPAPSPYTEQTGGLTQRCEPVSRPASPVRVVRTGRRVPRQRPPPVPVTHHVAQHVTLPSPPTSSLADGPDPESDLARAASLTVPHLLATVVTDSSFESAAAFALVTELVDFAAVRHLDYATAPVAMSGQEDFECLVAAVPSLVAMLLAPEGDPDAPDIPTPHSYAEAITGPYSSQWETAMDAKMASLKSTSTYIDPVSPSGTNIVDGMWIFRAKRLPGSLPAFKARYVARGFSQRQGVDFFQTFSPTPKMTTLRVLLHVAAQRVYELHFLEFTTAILQGSLHEEIWLCLPPGFTGWFSAGTQWSLRRPVYRLRQAPREWNDTLRTTLAALGFAPSTADPSLFLLTDTSLPPFYVLVLRP